MRVLCCFCVLSQCELINELKSGCAFVLVVEDECLLNERKREVGVGVGVIMKRGERQGKGEGGVNEESVGGG